MNETFVTRMVYGRTGIREAGRKALRLLRFFLRLMWDFLILTLGRGDYDEESPEDFETDTVSEFDGFIGGLAGSMG